MSDDKGTPYYPDTLECYRRKEAHRKEQARRPVSEKMAAVSRLREFEQKLEGIRKANKAKRAAREIKIEFKTLNATASGSDPLVGNVVLGIYHFEKCDWVDRISVKNRVNFATAAEAISHGFKPCQICSPVV